MNKLLSLLVFLLMCNTVSAQDVTVYNSPNDIDETISKLYFSIDKNGFSYMNTTEYKTNARGREDGFKGRIQVISFETDDVAKLAACEPTAMLDIPFKVLVWQEGDDTFLAFTNATHLRSRYMLRNCNDIITNINKAMIRVVNDAIRTD